MGIGNQWYWTYRQGTRPEYQSTLYRGALTSTSMMTNRWAMGYWAVSSNDVIHNWRVARVSDDLIKLAELLLNIVSLTIFDTGLLGEVHAHGIEDIHEVVHVKDTLAM